MDSEINDEKGENSNQGSRDTTAETPQSSFAIYRQTRIRWALAENPRAAS